MFGKLFKGKMFLTLGAGNMEPFFHVSCISQQNSRAMRDTKATERLRIAKPRIQKDIYSNLRVELATSWFCAVSVPLHACAWLVMQIPPRSL